MKKEIKLAKLLSAFKQTTKIKIIKTMISTKISKLNPLCLYLIISIIYKKQNLCTLLKIKPNQIKETEDNLINTIQEFLIIIKLVLLEKLQGLETVKTQIIQIPLQLLIILELLLKIKIMSQ